MCELSERLKLCTCDVGSVADLEHYWVLHRFDPAKYEPVIGRVRLPEALDGRVEADNRSVLLGRLNDGEAFDVDLRPQEGDRLQLTFRCSGPDASGRQRLKIITYGYTRTAERWAEEPFCPLEWRWRHDEARFGEVRPALKA